MNQKNVVLPAPTVTVKTEDTKEENRNLFLSDARSVPNDLLYRAVLQIEFNATKIVPRTVAVVSPLSRRCLFGGKSSPTFIHSIIKSLNKNRMNK
jgi:hypothetical protein